MRHMGAICRMFFLMAFFCAMIAGGCNSLKTSGIDPSGEHVFTSPPAVAAPSGQPYQEVPLSPLPWDPVTLILTPSVTVAPVGSEVVLVAGVGSADCNLRCNQRLEWAVTPGSAGQFVDVGKNDFVDVLLGDYNRPRLVNPVFAIGSTVSKGEQVKRGSSSPSEYIPVTPGQGWIKVASPVEGTSIVTVTAPKIVKGDQRTKTATIHWTDVTWRFPPPAINPAGTKHVFTTTVLRQSNQCPCPGWVVKYTISGGPPAGFSPDGASSIEVTTDAAGQANAEIFQKSPAHGTNQIGIEVIRPAELPGAIGQRMTVGTGSTMKTWTAADIAIKLSGPSMIAVGNTLTYRLDVSNPGDLPSKNIIVTNTLPDVLSYLGGNPPAEIAGKSLQWRLAELGPRQRQTIEINVRAEKEGSASNCADVITAGGLKVSDCATTTITAAAPATGAPTATTPPFYTPPSTSSLVDVRVSGPGMATIGSEATFDIVVTNRSQNTLNNLIVKDRFEPGLDHPASKEKKVIEYPLGDLPAGKSAKVEVTFRISKAGNLCHTVEVISRDTVLARSRACVTVSAQSTPTPGIAPPAGQTPSRATPAITPGTTPGPGPQTTPDYRRETAPPTQPPSAVAGVPVISVKHTGPQPPQLKISDIAAFIIQIANPNNRQLSNLKVAYRFDPALVPTLATDGFQPEGGNLIWVIPVLPAGTSRQLEVRCRCVKVAFKASNTVSVSTSEGAQATADAYLEIRSPPDTQPPGGTIPGGTIPGESTRGGTPFSGGTTTAEKLPGENTPAVTAPEPTLSAGDLTMTVAALREPVTAGKELTYEIRVVNNTNAVHRQATVTAMVPDGMIPAPLGTTGPGPTKFVIDRQTVSFNPVLEVRPGETLIYRVRVRTKSAGQFRFRAELTTQNLTQPTLQEASTEVF